MRNILAALEIGTTRTVLAIGESDGSSRLKVSCHAEIPSTGVRKSRILEMPQVTQSIKSVLMQIERKQDEAGSKITIGNTYLVVSGQHVKADVLSGTAQVEGSRVSNDEINAVLRSAHSMSLAKDRELLDIIDQDYVLDNFGGILNPLNMSGRVLRLNALQIHGDRDRIQDARTAAEAVHLEIQEPLFAATCAAEAVLEDHEKKNGVLVLDLGGGSTGYAVYTSGYTVSTGVIGVGGDHVTNDIAHAFQTTNAQAEALKLHHACALVGADAQAEPRVKVDQSDTPLMDNRTISRLALDTVVNARLMELLTVIRETLEDQDLLHRLHSGVVLTGGGARMKGLCELAKRTLGMNVRIGVPNCVDGLTDVDFPAEYAAIAGALLYAHREGEMRSSFRDFFGRLFK